jgi:para-nitrobenzyl esterase
MLAPESSMSRYVGPAEQGHDCLKLEVWTPDPRGSGLPVMVWIHGGGFVAGAGATPFHSGATFARDGVVYVTINYRLGVEGFLYLGPGTANLGLLDQVAALEWVRDNIEAFGGDPGNVTVFGQSAGGVSIMHLLTMPAAQGLFRRAIAQSGSSAGGEPLEGAVELTARLAEIVGVEPTIEGFSSVDEEALIAASGSYCVEYLSPILTGPRSFMVSPFRPVLDGEVVPDGPVPLAVAGAGASVELLAGTARDECTFIMYMAGLMEVVPEPYAAAALSAFGVSWDDLEAYRKGSRPEAGQGELLMAAWNDWAFRIPTIRLAEARVGRPGGAPTWLYELTWPSPTHPLAGAAHAIDLPFVFDRLRELHEASEPAEDLLGPDAPQALADLVHGTWVRFATHGDPGWAPYELDRRTTMRFDAESGPVEDLAGPVERQLWDGRR